MSENSGNSNRELKIFNYNMNLLARLEEFKKKVIKEQRENEHQKNLAKQVRDSGRD